MWKTWENVRGWLKNCEIRESYILPIMEYATFVWSPHTAANINKLEAVQRRAARFVMSNYDRHSSVTNMISVLQWKIYKKGGMFNLY